MLKLLVRKIKENKPIKHLFCKNYLNGWCLFKDSERVCNYNTCAEMKCDSSKH